MFKGVRYNQRYQQPGETIDSLVTTFHSLVENCKYGSLQEQKIHNWLVVGLLDVNLSKRLQMELNLKLADAVQKACNSEFAKVSKQSSEM